MFSLSAPPLPPSWTCAAALIRTLALTPPRDHRGRRLAGGVRRRRDRPAGGVRRRRRQVLTDGPYAIMGARESNAFAKYDRSTGKVLFIVGGTVGTIPIVDFDGMTHEPGTTLFYGQARASADGGLLSFFVPFLLTPAPVGVATLRVVSPAAS